jgi:outer membrane protein TolC
MSTAEASLAAAKAQQIVANEMLILANRVRENGILLEQLVNTQLELAKSREQAVLLEAELTVVRRQLDDLKDKHPDLPEFKTKLEVIEGGKSTKPPQNPGKPPKNEPA